MSKHCNASIYTNKADKENFINEYVNWKKQQFKSKSLFSTTTVERQTLSDNSSHHPFLSLSEIITDVFDRLDKSDKRSMAVVCKAWAALFLVGTETSKVDTDYKSQLAKENYNDTIRVTRKNTLVVVYCCCMNVEDKKEKRKIHKRIGKKCKAARLEEIYEKRYRDESGSEGYYDSDC